MTKTYATITVGGSQVRIWPAEKFEISQLVDALKPVILGMEIGLIMDREELGNIAVLNVDPRLGVFIAMSILNTMAADGWEAVGFPDWYLDSTTADAYGTIWLAKITVVLP